MGCDAQTQKQSFYVHSKFIQQANVPLAFLFLTNPSKDGENGKTVFRNLLWVTWDAGNHLQ